MDWVYLHGRTILLAQTRPSLVGLGERRVLGWVHSVDE